MSGAVRAGGLHDSVRMGLCGKPAGCEDAAFRRTCADHEDGGRLEDGYKQSDKCKRQSVSGQCRTRAELQGISADNAFFAE